MTRHGKRFATMAVAFAVTLIGLSLPAHAGLIFTLTDLGTGASTTISDQPTPGGSQTTFAGAPSGYTISAGTASSPTVLGYSSASFGDFASIVISVSSNYTEGANGLLTDFTFVVTGGAVSDTILLTVTSDQFTSPGAGTPISLESSLTNNVISGSGTSTFTSSLGTGSVGNATVGESFTPTATTALLNAGGVTGTFTNTAAGVTASPYALQNSMSATVGVGATLQVTGQTLVVPTAAVPEPATIMTALIGVALPLAGGAFRFGRRRRVQA
jgi:hypothetical protein